MKTPEFIRNKNVKGDSVPAYSHGRVETCSENWGLPPSWNSKATQRVNWCAKEVAHLSTWLPFHCRNCLKRCYILSFSVEAKWVLLLPIYIFFLIYNNSKILLIQGVWKSLVICFKRWVKTSKEAMNHRTRGPNGHTYPNEQRVEMTHNRRQAEINE